MPAAQAGNLSLAPNGRTVVSKGDSTWHLWDSFTGKPILTWQAHTGRIYALAFTPDGRHLVFAAAGSRGLDVVDVANPAAPIRRAELPAAGYTSDLALTDSQVVLTSGAGGVWAYDLAPIEAMGTVYGDGLR